MANNVHTRCTHYAGFSPSWRRNLLYGHQCSHLTYPLCRFLTLLEEEPVIWPSMFTLDVLTVQVSPPPGGGTCYMANNVLTRRTHCAGFSPSWRRNLLYGQQCSHLTYPLCRFLTLLEEEPVIWPTMFSLDVLTVQVSHPHGGGTCYMVINVHTRCTHYAGFSPSWRRNLLYGQQCSH